jgi:hypothetical protein
MTDTDPTARPIDSRTILAIAVPIMVSRSTSAR